MRRLLPALPLCTAALLAPPATAREDSPIRGRGKPGFVLELIALPGAPDSAKVEVLWEVPFRELAFRKEDRYYRARYDVTVVLSRRDRQVAGKVWERRVRTESLQETRGSRVSKGRKTLVVPVGNYDVRVSVTDRTTHGTSRGEGKIRATFGPTRIGLSDLRFVRYTEEGVVPNPGRDVPIGEPGHLARLTLHPETAQGGTFRVRWRFEGAGGRDSVTGDSTLVLTREPFLLELPIPSARLTPGAHHLRVRLEGAQGGSEESRTATFFVRLTPQWFTIHRPEAFEVLEVLATAEETTVLEAAPAGEWASRVEDFWRRRDPTPGTSRNEFRDSVLERMEAAASMFVEPFRQPGWRTDRGRVLLELGWPARRTLRPPGVEGPAAEIWEYDSPRRVFVFVDERGSGEFWLRG